MTPEQHNALTQLAQLGLQRLADLAGEALKACAPEPIEQHIEPAQEPNHD